jgi:hypothetical protein
MRFDYLMVAMAFISVVTCAPLNKGNLQAGHYRGKNSDIKPEVAHTVVRRGDDLAESDGKDSYLIEGVLP